MNSVRSFFVALAGFTFVAILAVFTASLTLLLAGLLSVAVIARLASLRLMPVPVRARKPQPSPKEMRIWNDGKGPIIDL